MMGEDRKRIGANNSIKKITVNVSLSESIVARVDEFVECLQEYQDDELPTEFLLEIKKRKRSGFIECAIISALASHSLQR